MNYRTQLKCDYKLAMAKSKKHIKFYGIGMLLTAVVSGLVWLAVPDSTADANIVYELPLPEKTLPVVPAIPLTAEAVETTQANAFKQVTMRVKKGDSLARLFKRHNFSASDLYNIMRSGKAAKQLKRIQPGDSFDIYFDDQRRIQKLHYALSKIEHIQVTRQDDAFASKHITKDVEKRMAYATTTINDSLFLDGRKAGLSVAVIMDLANIFGWDIDFALDIRSGDELTMIYEEHYLDGEKIKDGTILAAEFINRNKTYRALRYTNSKGNADYYSEDGKNLRKAFLRSPVDFARISSRFNLRRKHPILNRIRAHRGVDYAASRGTPIRATGNGKIVHRARKGGYGRTVVIKHGTRYSTLYAHLNSYKRGQRVGSKVKQGQIIGYVGSSGLATGPHLHYEFRVNGVHRNPLTVKLPSAKHLPKSQHADFRTQTANFVSQLDSIKRTRLALLDK